MKKTYLLTVLQPLALALSLFALSACETVQTTSSGVVGVDRQQRMLVSSAEIDQAAVQEYAQVLAQAKQKGLLDNNAAQVSRVRAVANRLIQQTPVFRPDASKWNWETHVLSSQEVNAWCMPGGKIAVYTGLIEKLHVTDDELAAVMGHEMAHALREPARERASEQAAAGLGISMLSARAGYNPQAAVTLWQKMENLGGSDVPTFLSTHPAPADRLSDLSVYSQRVMPLYQQAKR